jgi:hypothetical protein
MKTKKKSKLTNDSSKLIDDDLHRISFREIKILMGILSGPSRGNFVRARFLQDGLNYSDVTNFLKQLGLLRLFKGKMSKSDSIGVSDEEMKSVLVQRLLAGETPYRPHINDFFGQFKRTEDRFEIVMGSEGRQRFSGLRNLFLDLDFLEHDFDSSRYWISSQYLMAFIGAKSVLAMTPLELQEILHAREKLGREAEHEVLKFEMARLQRRPDLVKQIKHVASDNVSAGYDILSFTECVNSSDVSERLIEVKAVSLNDFKFYWSGNEIEMAHNHGLNYFLYLVPVCKNGFDMQKLKIIQNPFKRVYLDGKSWLRQEELVSFSALRPFK